MTIDGLLSLALAIVIPFLLAAAGGVLAVRTLGDAAEKKEKWVWIGVFILLLVIGIVLGVIQQVRITDQQRTADVDAAAERLRNEGNVKYTQGQLDSINKVLAQVVGEVKSSNSSTPEVTKALLEGALLASNRSNGIEAPAIQKMSNAQLRSKVIDLANDMSSFASQADVAQEQRDIQHMSTMADARVKDGGVSPGPNQQKAWNIYTQSEQANYTNLSLMISQKYVGISTQYHQELERRLGPQKSSSSTEDVTALWSIIPTGHYSTTGLNVTAAVLERMARNLPN
jgi:hypothetical protein